ncbi:phosphoglycerol transferase MdoB-like AlkP superfamily enzyme [Peribacillus deserti]|uniref:Phosphoglycerol transferase MdoB-like AlkP superfamily enzyme n=1 Tax=Peribacillus deserti TaxID=673318 RepID=A0ABS2QG23_9BACI|nr:hypothetical protein [Peribacillus deserti]MBM7691769.1 phosphoglycerol transferase MdoB-like AlkP superfamily enzyme [Peribacillus deserti]
MNLEAKQMIRWGMPGWLFISVMFTYFTIDDKKAFIRFLKEWDISLLGLTALLIGFGFILGYVIHQVSLLFGFVIWNKWENYFRNEFKMDHIIINKPCGPEIQRIYSYRSGQVYALRALTTSFILSCMTLILLFYFHSWSTGSIVLFLINAVLLVISFVNQRYFRKNLEYFMTRTLIENNRV